MYNYCTLFNTGYLSRGLAMYESLKKYSESFHLYIFAFDNICFNILNKLDLEYATILTFEDFEDEELRKLRKERTYLEYCWTCTPSITKFSIEKYNLENCTYVDSDVYFFSNPAVLIEEMERDKSSVLIIEHRYTPRYCQNNVNGIYCVQFMTFKNNNSGMNVLNWWRDACNRCCCLDLKNNMCGDQKYLDDWMTRFDCVHELKHLGGGVAPWNIQQYIIKNEKNKLVGYEKSSKLCFDLVFYHFHALKFLDKGKIQLGTYILDKEDIRLIYAPYLRHLDIVTKNLEKLDNSYDYNGIQNPKKSWKDPLIKLKRKLKGYYNVFDKNEIVGMY